MSDAARKQGWARGLPVAAGLLALLGLAIALRAWGLGWGVPHAGRFYPFHPDESVLLRAVYQVNPLWLDFEPGFYNYGTFYLFLCRLAYDLTAPFQGWGPVPGPFSAWNPDFAHLLLLSRWVSVALGAGTVLLTFKLGERLFGARTGWLAAAFLAVAPLPAVLGHYMAVDVPSTFFTTLALLLAAAALRQENGARARWWMVAAGLAGGLATGTKYTCFPCLFAVLAPAWRLVQGTTPRGRRDALLGLTGAALASGVAFLVATPGALLETDRFLTDVLYELGRNREGQGLIFQATPPALLYHLGISLPVGLEWPLFLLALAGVAWSVRRRRPEDVLLWLFLIPFTLLLAPAERKFLRYVTPLLPPLLVLAARCVDEGLAGRRPVVFRLAAGTALAAALLSTVAHLGVLAAPDAREQAAAYLREQTTPGQTVALASDAWYYTPPVHPTTGAVKLAEPWGGPPVWDAVIPGGPGVKRYRLEWGSVLAPSSSPVPSGALPVAKLREQRPERVVVTDYEYEDPLRVRAARPDFQSGIIDLLDALDQDYRLEREFRPRPAVGGIVWWRRGIPPHDWRYFMPTVRVYVRK